MLSSTLAGAGGEPRSCVSSRRRRRGTYTYRETLQHTPDPAPNVVSADPAPETVGSPELEGELPLSGTKRGRGRGLTTTLTARGAVDECPTAKETAQPALRLYRTGYGAGSPREHLATELRCCEPQGALSCGSPMPRGE